MNINKQHIDFISFDNEYYRYRQSDGYILKLNKNNPEPIVENSFAIDYERVNRNIDNSLGLLIINTTSNCNLRCKYCIYSSNYEGEPAYNDTVMSFDIAIVAINYLFDHSKSLKERVLSLYGGEPLSSKTKSFILRATEYAKEKSKKAHMPISFAVATNGTSLDEWSDWLIENDVSLFISLDGPEIIHDRWRGNGSFDRIIKGINSIKNKSIHYFNKKVLFSSTFVDVSDLPQIKYFFNEYYPHNNIRISGVRLNGLSSTSPLRKTAYNEASKSLLENYAKDYVEAIFTGVAPDNFLKALFDQMMMIIYYRHRGFRRVFWPTNTCVPGGKKLFIREDGKYYICEKCFGDGFQIGDAERGVELNNVIDILDGYNTLCNTLCRNCWAPRICNACFISVREGGQMALKVLEESCINRLKTLELGLKIYTTSVIRNKESMKNYINSLIPLM